MLADRSQRASRSSQIVRNFEALKQQIQINNQIRTERQSGQQQIQVPLDPNAPHQKEAGAGNRAPLQNFEVELNQHDQQSNINFVDKNNAQGQQDQKQQNNDQMKKKIASNIDVFDDHKISLDALKEKYHTDYEKGLHESYAIEQNRKLGDNILTAKEKGSLIVKFILEITNAFSCLLWAGSALCFLAYGLDKSDPSNLYLGVVLVVLILVSGGISFQQNLASEALMDSFKSFLPSNCTIIRDGKEQIIAAAKLVPGDIVKIKAGEKIPADVRIVQSSEMKVDNSPLTGESEPQLRSNICTHPENPLETANLAFFGTLCKEGQGKGIVVRIGDGTTLGQIANLTQQESKAKSPLRQELDHLVKLVIGLALILGIIFFFLGWQVIGYPVLPCVLFGIGILVANVPEGLMGEVTVCLAVTARCLAAKNVLVKNLEAVETLGSTSCICTDKTGTLTQNRMTVENMWYNKKVIKAVNKSMISETGQTLEYDVSNPTFEILHKAAILSSEAKFDLQNETNLNNVDYKKCNAMGDATETGIIRFYQYIEDIEQTRRKVQIAKQIDGQDARMPFNSTNKFALIITEEQTNDSDYCVYIKGAPEKIWTFCSKILSNGVVENVEKEWDKQFNDVNLQFGKQGQRVLGFAKLHLPRMSYPLGKCQFTVSTVEKFNFQMTNFTFIGLISFIDPPKTRVPAAILECRSAGIKVIMVTGDQPPTAAAIARQVNIIPKSVKTNIEIMDEEHIDWDTASEKCKAIVVHGDQIVKSLNREMVEGLPEFTYLREWVKKPYCVFARTTPAQKLQIVKACQAEGYVCAVTGDGVNDSPAIKQGDIGISMNISGSDVTKDSADMVLLDDDFASIVCGIEEGRKIFDNLKKAIVYVITTNIPEIFPFLAFIIFQIPVPISNIFMIVLCVGTDIVPAISLGYEIAEIDVMTRKPRKKTDHLVSPKIVVHAYVLMGPIAFGGGMVTYFTAFNQFGFPINSLFGLATMSGIAKPPAGDFSEGTDPVKCKNILGNDCAYFNSNIMQSTSKSCTDDLEFQKSLQDKDKAEEWAIDWLSDNDGAFDLRKGLIKCDETTKKWTPVIDFSPCSLDNNQSPISGTTACYTTEALKYTQSAYLMTIIFFQISNVFACKSRQNPYYLTPPNSLMFIGILVEILIGIFLLYVPGVQKVFGARPVTWWLFAMPGLTFSVTLLLWEEIRKYLVRNNVWFEKYSFW